jgi:hypothetical protein
MSLPRGQTSGIAGQRAGPHRTPERSDLEMSTQINVFQVETLGAMPAALVVLMMILAVLGIVANVAAA